MQVKYIDGQLKYDGLQLSSLFAFKQFDLQGDSVVAFVGPCQVDIPHLVDQVDVKEGGFIYSESMVHFIGEFFGLDLPKGVFRQRLYIAIIKETLESLCCSSLVRRGDDLFVDERKLTVSIATLSPVSTMLHIGVNISSANTPVPAIGLADLGVAPEVFIKKVLAKVKTEEESIALACCKVRGVQ